MILSGEEKLANDKANMGYTFAEFGASTVVPEDQNAVCQSLLAVGFPDYQLYGW